MPFPPPPTAADKHHMPQTSCPRIWAFLPCVSICDSASLPLRNGTERDGTGRDGTGQPAPLITGPVPAQGCSGAVKALQPAHTCLFRGRDTDEAPGLHREQTPVFEETGVLQQTESGPVCSGNIHGPGSKSNSFIVCLVTNTITKLQHLALQTATKCHGPVRGVTHNSKGAERQNLGFKSCAQGERYQFCVLRQHRNRPWGKQETSH